MTVSEPILLLTQEKLDELVHASVARALLRLLPTAAPAAPVAHPWMTVHEVAAFLKVNERTVRAWSKSGRLPAPHRVGDHSLRWARSDIERHMEQQR